MTEVKTVHFPSKEKALQYYIKSEDVKGIIRVVTTTKDDTLLVTQKSGNIYFVGELKKDNKGYFTRRILSNILLNTNIHADFKSLDGNSFTIYYKNKRETSNFIPLTKSDYYFSIKGNISNNGLTGSFNAIKNVQDYNKKM